MTKEPAPSCVTDTTASIRVADMPQYRIIATKRCKTHPPGSLLIYTGPRNGVASGWRVLGRVYEADTFANVRGVV